MFAQIHPERKIEGISAILLPFDKSGQIDLDGFAAHIERTFAAGLTPAVNMDTGYVNLLSPKIRQQLLSIASQSAGGRPFVAGAYIEGEQGDPTDLYGRETEAIQAQGGLPVLFQCSALKQMNPDQIVSLYQSVASCCSACLAFELGEMFAPLWANLPAGSRPGDYGDPADYRDETLFAQARAGMAAFGAA